MPAVTEAQLEKLRPYVAGQQSSTGEVYIYCMFHNDGRASGQLNMKKGFWYCHAGCGGGTVKQAIEDEEYWVPMEGRKLLAPSEGGKAQPAPMVESISNSLVRRWHRDLLENSLNSRERLESRRGISRGTIERFQLGYDSERRLYTIPVRSARGKLWNVRRYDITPIPGRRKIWGLTGRNQPRLYPARVLRNAETIIICEGEWDALLTIQNGFAAITRTGAAKVWAHNWTQYFADREVYVCHDRDKSGEQANKRISAAIKAVAAKVSIITLPYPFQEKNGKDLTDFWLDGASPDDLRALMV